LIVRRRRDEDSTSAGVRYLVRAWRDAARALPRRRFTVARRWLLSENVSDDS
jgi:hypothetical protein